MTLNGHSTDSAEDRANGPPTLVGHLWSVRSVRWTVGATAALCSIALLAGFLAPYDYRVQDRAAIKAPPSRLRFVDAEGRFHLRPFIYRSRLIDRASWRYEEDPSWRYPLVFFVRGDSVDLFGGLKTTLHLFGVGAGEPVGPSGNKTHPARSLGRVPSGGLRRGDPTPESKRRSLSPTRVGLSEPGKRQLRPSPPGALSDEGSRGSASTSVLPTDQPSPEPLRPPPRIYLLGADHLGRDIFSRLLFGSRPALVIALASGLAALTIGLAVGCLAGYYGGIVDALFMRLNELVESVPVIFFILAVRSALPLDLSSGQALGVLIAIFGAVGWTTVARLTRGCVLTLVGREFIVGARAVGASDAYILQQHIIPHAVTPALTQATLTVPAFLLAEATLSFLGVGISEPEPSWGNMLAAARELSVMTGQPWMLSPGIAIVAAVALFTVMGNSIRHALDPQSQTSAPEWL